MGIASLTAEAKVSYISEGRSSVVVGVVVGVSVLGRGYRWRSPELRAGDVFVV